MYDLLIKNAAVVTAEAAVKTKKPKIAIEILNKLLADNPKTARFFDAKFLLADAMMASIGSCSAKNAVQKVRCVQTGTRRRICGTSLPTNTTGLSGRSIIWKRKLRN